MATSVYPTATSGYVTPTATPTGSTPTPITVTVAVGSSYSSSSRSHTIAIAAGVSVAVGAVVASIIILAFIFFRRRQMRKSSATISPNSRVMGPKEAEHTNNWMREYRRESQGSVKGSASFPNSKEPPAYIKGI